MAAIYCIGLSVISGILFMAQICIPKIFDVEMIMSDEVAFGVCAIVPHIIFWTMNFYGAKLVQQDREDATIRQIYAETISMRKEALRLCREEGHTMMYPDNYVEPQAPKPRVVSSGYSIGQSVAIVAVGIASVCWAATSGFF